MAKQKYYAYFFDDERNGIVESWTECEKIVKGTKARYKSFIDKAVAQNWLDSGANYERKINSTTPINSKLEKGIYFDSGTGRGIGVEVRITDEKAKELADYMLNKKDLEINSLRDKNVITANNLKDLYDKKIIISKNTVVTTLAKERAKENNIVFEEK